MARPRASSPYVDALSTRPFLRSASQESEGAMLPQSSSSDSPEIRHISSGEMRLRLRQAFAQDPESSLLWQLSRQLQDPLQTAENGGFRVHPLWLSLGAISLLALSAFIYFTFMR